MKSASKGYWPSECPVIVYEYRLYVVVGVSREYHWLYARPIGEHDISVMPIKSWECVPLTALAKELVAHVDD